MRRKIRTMRRLKWVGSEEYVEDVWLNPITKILENWQLSLYDKDSLKMEHCQQERYRGPS